MSTFPEKLQDRMNLLTEAREHHETMVYTPEMDKELKLLDKLYQKCQFAGVDLIGFKPYSTHPDDYYLLKVICERKNTHFHPFVIWTYNNEDGGFHDGHYYASDKEAFKDFITKH